jgi:hypothetical protein
VKAKVREFYIWSVDLYTRPSHVQCFAIEWLQVVNRDRECFSRPTMIFTFGFQFDAYAKAGSC